MTESVLRAIHGGEPPGDFENPWVVSGDPARFGPPASLGRDWDAAALAAAGHRPLKVRSPGGAERWLTPDADGVGEVRTAEMAGFWAVEATVSGLVPWLVALAAELGVWDEHVTANAYLSRSGAGYGAHLDPYEVYVLQLQGHKDWALAPGADDVEWPIHSLTLGDPDQDVPRYLARAASRRQMPEPVFRTRLSPGDALFVPRGWWHRTEATGTSWSVSVTVATPSWAELMLRVLAGHLGDLATYRRPAYGALDPERAESVVVLDELLRKLSEEIGRADAGILLDELRRP